MPRPEYTRRMVMQGAGASWGAGALAALAGFAPDAFAEPDPSPASEPFDPGWSTISVVEKVCCFWGLVRSGKQLS